MSEVVMMLTERGMRILMEELRKGGNQPHEVFSRLSEPEPSEEDVNELVEEYLDYKEPKQVNYNEETRAVVDYLVQEGEPVRLADIREHMQELGYHGWEMKTSTQRMQKIMKEVPNISNLRYGMYEYIGGEEDDNNSNETETFEAREIPETGDSD